MTMTLPEDLSNSHRILDYGGCITIEDGCGGCTMTTIVNKNIIVWRPIVITLIVTFVQGWFGSHLESITRNSPSNPIPTGDNDKVNHSQSDRTTCNVVVLAHSSSSGSLCSVYIHSINNNHHLPEEAFIVTSYWHLVSFLFSVNRSSSQIPLTCWLARAIVVQLKLLPSL